MKKIFFLLIIIVSFKNAKSQCTLDYSKFTEIWTEDFNGTMEDVEENWRVGEYEWGNFNDHKKYRTTNWGTTKHITFLSDKSNMTVANGKMHMKNTKLPEYIYKRICEDTNDLSTCKDYRVKYTYSTMETTTGEIFGNTNCDDIDENGGWLYGLFEVRCKIPNDVMMFSTFWMLGSDEASAEVDIFEIDNYCPGDLNAQCTSYDFTNGVSSSGGGNTEWSRIYNKASNLNFYDEFHTWSMLWAPDKITFYLDGNEYRTWYGSLNLDGTPLSCHWRRMKIILTAKPSNKAHLIENYANFNPNTEFVIDWVKVSKPINGSYQDNDIPALTANNINTDINNIKDNIKMEDNTLYYWNKDDNKLVDLYYKQSDNKWDFKESFENITHTIKQEPLVESNSKVYYKGNNNKLYNFYKSNGTWYNAQIDGSQQIIDKYFLTDYVGFSQIVYTDMNRRLKHFIWLGSWTNDFMLDPTDAGKKANDNLIVKDDFIFYEGRKSILGVWWRDKYLWVGDKTFGTGLVSHKFPNKLYTQGTSFDIKNFECTPDGHKVFYITENHQLRYHEYNTVSKTWLEDIIINDGIQNVYDNLVVTHNGNKVFYTNASGHIFNFYKQGGIWHNSIINWNNTVDINKVNHLSYDAVNERLYFTTTYINPSLAPTVTNGVIQYFEWSTIDGQWHYRHITVADNNTNADNKKGRVCENVQLLENGDVLYTDQEHNGYIISEPEVCEHLVYNNNTHIRGIGTNKTDADNITENFLDEDEMEAEQIPGTGTMLESGTYYHVYDNDYELVSIIESVFPNTTKGVFTLSFLDSALIYDNDINRTIKIIKPYTDNIIDEKIIPASEKSVTFDISNAPEGNYSIVVTENSGSVDSRVLIKIN